MSANDHITGATQPDATAGSLQGLRVLDLTRILAGPTATQLLGDLGAEVIKIERPGGGDDTRGWGPPFLKDRNGEDTAESAYYLCANRSKKSVAVDIASDDGQRIIRALAKQSDVLVENFKAGGLKRYGLDYESLSKLNPALIYCSITGFGQTGPLAARPGYDFMIQGMGGIMSLTGFPDDQGGEPTKVGVGIADVMTGMYAVAGILSALHTRGRSGKGQYIDVALYDAQISWLINQGAAYLVSGEVPVRRGNDHPTIVPYGAFPGADQSFIIAVGNDAQFKRLCDLADAPELAADERFARNASRVRNRDTLIPLLRALTIKKPAHKWLEKMEANGIPCGPINDLEAVFSHPQTIARGMRIELPHPVTKDGKVALIGNPLKLSDTPVAYAHAPPMLGQHTSEVLRDMLEMSDDEISAFEASGVISRRTVE